MRKVLIVYASLSEHQRVDVEHCAAFRVVVPELQCPNAPDTVTTSSPDEIKAEAAKCLKL